MPFKLQYNVQYFTQTILTEMNRSTETIGILKSQTRNSLVQWSVESIKNGAHFCIVLSMERLCVINQFLKDQSLYTYPIDKIIFLSELLTMTGM